MWVCVFLVVYTGPVRLLCVKRRELNVPDTERVSTWIFKAYIHHVQIESIWKQNQKKIYKQKNIYCTWSIYTTKKAHWKDKASEKKQQVNWFLLPFHVWFNNNVRTSESLRCPPYSLCALTCARNRRTKIIFIYISPSIASQQKLVENNNKKKSDFFCRRRCYCEMIMCDLVLNFFFHFFNMNKFCVCSRKGNGNYCCSMLIGWSDQSLFIDFFLSLALFHRKMKINWKHATEQQHPAAESEWLFRFDTKPTTTTTMLSHWNHLLVRDCCCYHFISWNNNANNAKANCLHHRFNQFITIHTV